eukprot:TRINITY_DN22799_c0_g1_i1.p1 TRINITY_DN22799_c0_g1~~TRINITY_DN22799_c0_g1_i1.p1  ORF type:complete len:591 (+),score=125.56 TRINITY_DN22799_c0_g1_i1:36-1808(+)
MARVASTKALSRSGGGSSGGGGAGLPPLSGGGQSRSDSEASLPRCATVNPSRYKQHEKQAKNIRRRLRDEEMQRLDFHGFGGDINGLRAFLAHKHGSAARGWRRIISTDETGVRPVTFNEFCRALQRAGYGGQSLTLWRSLSKGSTTVGLEDMEPELARQLDGMVRKWCKTFSDGGSLEAWEELPREHAGRVTFDEFSNFIKENSLNPRPPFDVRRVFDFLDVHGLGSLTREDLRVLDHWASRRLDAPLPEEEEVENSSEEEWAPPPSQQVRPPGLKEFRQYLERRYGSAARAWRVVLDCKCSGFLMPSDFGMGCRQAGWKHPHAPLWRELREAGGGLVTLRALDPETVEAIDKLNDAIRASFQDIYVFWGELVDPQGTGAVSCAEFTTGVARELGLDAATARRVFACLDTQNTGWVAMTEIGFLDICDAERPNLDGGSLNSFPSAASGVSARGGSAIGIGGIGFGSPSSPGTSSFHSTGLFAGTAGELSATSLSTPSLSVPSRGSMQVLRPTRCALQRSFSQSHMSKHRWLGGASLERCLHASKKMPPTKKFPWTKDRDIFRCSNEFYREGVKLLTAQRPAEETDEDND